MNVYKVSMYAGLKDVGGTLYKIEFIKTDKFLTATEIEKEFYERVNTYPKTHYLKIEDVTKDKDSGATHGLKLTIKNMENLDEFMNTDLVLGLEMFSHYDRQAIKDSIIYLKRLSELNNIR